jgi:hypothetical protein
MGVAAFLIGTVAGQIAGAWAYLRVRRTQEPRRELLAATMAGLVTTGVASAVYIPLGVHEWLGGVGSSWG